MQKEVFAMLPSWRDSSLPVSAATGLFATSRSAVAAAAAVLLVEVVWMTADELAQWSSCGERNRTVDRNRWHWQSNSRLVCVARCSVVSEREYQIWRADLRVVWDPLDTVNLRWWNAFPSVVWQSLVGCVIDTELCSGREKEWLRRCRARLVWSWASLDRWYRNWHVRRRHEAYLE